MLAEKEEHFKTYEEAKDAYDNFVKYEEKHLNDMTCNPMREPICAEIALWSSKDYEIHLDHFRYIPNPLRHPFSPNVLRPPPRPPHTHGPDTF